MNFTGDGDFLVLVHFFPFCKEEAIMLLVGDSCAALPLYPNQFGKKRSTRGVCIYL